MPSEETTTTSAPAAPAEKKPFFEFGYKWKTGMTAWMLHRLTGLALIFYLCLHIFVIRNLGQGEAQFNQIMKTLGSPMFKVLEIGLLAVVLFHTFNGIRIVIIDFWGGSRIHKQLFWIMTIISIVLFIAGGIPMTVHLFKMMGH